jgi:hypothetical protein
MGTQAARASIPAAAPRQCQREHDPLTFRRADKSACVLDEVGLMDSRPIYGGDT